MTEKELNRLDWLRRRKSVLQAERRSALSVLRGCSVTGVVQGSRLEEPYNLHPVVVQGLPDNEESREAVGRWAMARMDLADVEMQIRERVEYIRRVEDPMVRDLMERHWLRGESWVSISTKMGKSESWARMTVSRYLKEK